MKATYCPSERLSIEFDFETAADFFRQMGPMQEVLEAEKACGVCSGTELRFLARKVQKYEYFELSCGNPKCRARFAFGQHTENKGSLFPKRKDEDGNWLANRGWVKWSPEKKTDA